MTEQPTPPPHGASEQPSGAGEAPQSAGENLRTLRRSRDERMLAGVLGGLAQRLSVDPVLLRIATVVLAIFGGVGIVIYAAGWLLIPDEGTDRSIAEQALGRGEDRPEPATLWLAGGLVLAVLFASGATFGSGVGPVLLVLAAAGVIVLLRRDGDSPTTRFADHAPGGDPPDPVPERENADAAGLSAQATGRTPPGDTGVGSTGAGSSEAGIPAADDSHSVVPPDDSETVADDDRREYVHSFTAPVQPASAWPDPPDWPGTDPGRAFDVPGPPEPVEPPTSHLGSLTLSAAAVALGVLAIVDAAGAVIPASAYVTLALAIIGMGLLIGTWFGRARGLIAWGLIGTLVALPAAALGDFLDWDLSGEDRTITISEVGALPEEPRSHGMGRVVYDLSDLELSEAADETLSVSQSMGAMQIIVPPEADVTVNAATNMGHIAAFAEQAAGHQDMQVIDLGADGDGGGSLTLDLDLGMGEIRVERAGDVPPEDLGNQGAYR